MQSPSTVLPTQSDYSNNSLCLPWAFDFAPLCWATFFSTMLFLPSEVNLLSPSCPTRCYLIILLLFCSKTPKICLYLLTPLLPVSFNLSKAGFITQSSHETALIKVTRDLCITKSNGQFSLFLLFNLASAFWADHLLTLDTFCFTMLPRHTFLVYSTGMAIPSQSPELASLPFMQVSVFLLFSVYTHSLANCL